MLTQTPEGPSAGDIVATVYRDSSASALYVEPLRPQPLNCLGPVGVGCPVARVWYGLANVTPQQQANAEWLYASPATTGAPSRREGCYPLRQIWPERIDDAR